MKGLQRKISRQKQFENYKNLKFSATKFEFISTKNISVTSKIKNMHSVKLKMSGGEKAQFIFISAVKNYKY